MTALIDKGCRSTVYLTPPHILDAVRAYFGGTINLDPATEPNNPTNAKTFYTEADNGLYLPWTDRTFVNPPYGRALMKWVEKICDEADDYNPEIVALLPGQRFETRTWQDCLLPCTSLSAIVFLKGRLKFLRPDGTPAKSNPYGSMLYIFNDAERSSILSSFGHLGYIIWK